MLEPQIDTTVALPSIPPNLPTADGELLDKILSDGLGWGLSKLESQGKAKLNSSDAPELSLWAGPESQYVMGSSITFLPPTMSK